MSLVLIFLFSQATLRAELALCSRDPQITLVDSISPTKKSCAGSVKIQGIQFRCSKPGLTEAQTTEFLRTLNNMGVKRCDEFCSSTNKKCRGIFTRTSRCGHTIPANHSEAYGKYAPCPKHCEGYSFNYCSLLHGSYLTVSSELLRQSSANCVCTEN